MILYFTSFSTPFGRFAAAVDDAGRVAVTAFTPESSASRNAPPQQTLSDPATTALRRRFRAKHRTELVRDDHRTAAIRDQVLAYARGEREDFDLPLHPLGSSFEKRVWAKLQQIPLGETRTYSELAAQLGSGPRAIGGANARNPICLLVPCHRVVGKNGTLTGFAFGIALKQQLLDHERLVASSGRLACATR